MTRKDTFICHIKETNQPDASRGLWCETRGTCRTSKEAAVSDRATCASNPAHRHSRNSFSKVDIKAKEHFKKKEKKKKKKY